jgi:hypothetical protein
MIYLIVELIKWSIYIGLGLFGFMVVMAILQFVLELFGDLFNDIKLYSRIKK